MQPLSTAGFDPALRGLLVKDGGLRSMPSSLLVWPNNAKRKPWTPAKDASLLLWREATKAYVNGATDGGALTTLTARFPGSYNFVANGSGLTWSAANKAVVMDSSHALTNATPIPFATSSTAYAVLKIGTGSSTLIPFGSTNGQYTGLFLLTSTVYAMSDANEVASAAYTGANFVVLLRWRRRADNHVLFTATGMAETDLGAITAACSLTTCGSRTLSGLADTVGNDERAGVITAADTVAAGTDAKYLAYFKKFFGVTL